MNHVPTKFRFGAASVLVTLALSCIAVMLSASIAEAQVDSCQSPCTDSTEWVGETIFVRLPQYPDCEVELRYRRRGCAQGTEIDFQWLQWQVPTNPDDSTDPCYELHEAWLSAGPSRDIFLRDLYNYALQANTDYLFNRDYTFDSLNLIVNPTDPDLQQRLTARQCPDGQTVFLVTHAKCMIAIARPYQEAATRRKDESPERGLSAPADGIVELMKIRYAPCGVSQSYCCVIIHDLSGHHYQSQCTAAYLYAFDSADMSRNIRYVRCLPTDRSG